MVEVPANSTTATVRVRERPKQPWWVRDLANNKLIIAGSVVWTGVVLAGIVGFRRRRMPTKPPVVGRWRESYMRRTGKRHVGRPVSSRQDRNPHNPHS